MKRPRAQLIVGGLTLALWGMSYGLWYAVAAEHQALDRMGGDLASAFARAAARDSSGSASSLRAYGSAAFAYTRQVDVHSHWIGLAMLLIFLGLIFDKVHLGDGLRACTASALLAGAVVFPAGVLLQTTLPGPLPSALAIAGAALVTASLALVVVGLLRSRAA